MGRTRPAGFSRWRKQYRFGTFQDLPCHLTRDRREALEKFFQTVIVFQVIEQRFDRNACSLENRRTSENVGINRDEIAHLHVDTTAGFRLRVKR